MAKIEHVILTCDRCEKDEDDKIGTVEAVDIRFGAKLGSPHLCQSCITTVTGILERYKVGKLIAVPKRRSRSRKTNYARVWAKAQGIEVGNRGTVPSEVQKAFQAAGSPVSVEA